MRPSQGPIHHLRHPALAVLPGVPALGPAAACPSPHLPACVQPAAACDLPVLHVIVVLAFVLECCSREPPPHHLHCPLIQCMLRHGSQRHVRRREHGLPVHLGPSCQRAAGGRQIAAAAAAAAGCTGCPSCGSCPLPSSAASPAGSAPTGHSHGLSEHAHMGGLHQVVVFTAAENNAG